MKSLSLKATLLAFFCLILLPEGSAWAEKRGLPRGYLQTLIIEHQGRIYRFGPFVGYYFKPFQTTDLTRLQFICYNERSFYTRDVPKGEKLFQGEARFECLPVDAQQIPKSRDRMSPVFAGSIPKSWLQNRPEPQSDYRHFHSCYNAAGASACGFWLKHEALQDFTYDMGGRVNADSPLYHRVQKGVDRKFPLIVEFDQGPQD